MALLLCGGTAIGEIIELARTRPKASMVNTSSIASRGVAACNKRSKASSTESKGGGVLAFIAVLLA